MTFHLRQTSSALVAAILFGAGLAPAAIAPAETNSFEEVTARLDRGGSLYLYLSTAQWLDGLSKNVAGYRDLVVDQSKAPEEREKIGRYFDLGIDLLQKSGLEQISGVGVSSVAVEPGVYRNTFFLHHYRGKDTGLMGTISGGAPHPLTALALLPANTALAAFSDSDLSGFITSVRAELEKAGIPELKKSIDDGVAQFAQLTGLPLDAVLQSLGGGLGMVLTLDPANQVEFTFGGETQAFPSPRLALLIETKDDRIFRRIDQLVGGFPGIVKADEPALHLRTMAFPAMPNFTVRATVAQTDKFLIVASDDSLVRDILAAQTSGQGFKSTPAFAKMSAGLPAEGTGFNLVTQPFVDAWKQVRAQMLKAQRNRPASEEAIMQKLMDAQSLAATYSVSSHVENGWLTVSRSSQGASQMLAPLLVIPGIAVGAAIPVYTKMFSQPAPAPAPEANKSAESLEKVKKIYAACKAYAGDHEGKYPPTLEALAPKYVQDPALFVSPFAADEPIGYLYTPGLTVHSPAYTVLLEDKFARDEEGERVVVYARGAATIKKVE